MEKRRGMSKGLNITPVGLANGERRSSTLNTKFKIGPTSIKFVTVVIIALVTLFYLAQVQLEGSKRHEVSDLKNQAEDLQKETKRLETEVVTMQSIQSIKKEAESLNMIPVTQVNYIDNNTKVVATKK